MSTVAPAFNDLSAFPKDAPVAAPKIAVSPTPLVIDPPAVPPNNLSGPPDTVTKEEISDLLGLSGPHTDRLIGKRGAKLEPVRGPSGGLGRTRRYARADVERLIAKRAAEAAERERFRAVVPPDQPFKGEPVVAPRRPPAPAPQPTLDSDGPELSPAFHDDALDPVALGVELPRERPGEASINRKNDRLFLGAPSSKALSIGPTPAQLAAKKARNDARAAALASYDPSKVKRLPSAADRHETYLAERARFDEETARLARLKEKPFKSGMTIEERQELDRDERIMLQRASWVVRGVMPPK